MHLLQARTQQGYKYVKMQTIRIQKSFKQNPYFERKKVRYYLLEFNTYPLTRGS